MTKREEAVANAVMASTNGAQVIEHLAAAGYYVVPKTPTAAMVARASRLWDGGTRATRVARKIYAAMLRGVNR